MTRHMSEEVRREQILEAARLAFVETGYIPTRMEDIARRAGLSKGGVYFHFSSKRELFDALVQQEYDQSMEYLEAVRSREGTVQEKLEDLGRFYPLYFAAHPEAARFFVVMSEVAMRDVEIRDRLSKMHHAYIRVLSAVLEGGIASGELRPFNTLAVATLLKSMMDGLEGSFALGFPAAIDDLLSSGISILIRGMVSEAQRDAAVFDDAPAEAPAHRLRPAFHG